jgi:hypothetical protein
MRNIIGLSYFIGNVVKMWRSVKIPSKSGLGGLDLIPCLLEAFKQGTAIEFFLIKKPDSKESGF